MSIILRLSWWQRRARDLFEELGDALVLAFDAVASGRQTATTIGRCPPIVASRWSMSSLSDV